MSQQFIYDPGVSNVIFFPFAECQWSGCKVFLRPRHLNILCCCSLFTMARHHTYIYFFSHLPESLAWRRGYFFYLGYGLTASVIFLINWPSMFILSMNFSVFYIQPLSDWSQVCFKACFKNRSIYSFFTLSPKYETDLLSRLPACQKLMALSVLLVSSFVAFVRCAFPSFVSSCWVFLAFNILIVKCWHHYGFLLCDYGFGFFKKIFIKKPSDQKLWPQWKSSRFMLTVTRRETQPMSFSS